MSLGTLLLAVYLILVGMVSLFSVAIPGWVLGLIALIAGILILVEGYRGGVIKVG